MTKKSLVFILNGTELKHNGDPQVTPNDGAAGQIWLEKKRETREFMGMRPQGNEQGARRNKHVRSAPAKIAVKALGEDVLDGILDKSPNPLLLILDCVQEMCIRDSSLAAPSRNAAGYAGRHAVQVRKRLVPAGSGTF